MHHWQTFAVSLTCYPPAVIKDNLLLSNYEYSLVEQYGESLISSWDESSSNDQFSQLNLYSFFITGWEN